MRESISCSTLPQVDGGRGRSTAVLRGASPPRTQPVAGPPPAVRKGGAPPSLGSVRHYRQDKQRYIAALAGVVSRVLLDKPQRDEAVVESVLLKRQYLHPGPLAGVAWLEIVGRVLTCASVPRIRPERSGLPRYFEKYRCRFPEQLESAVVEPLSKPVEREAANRRPVEGNARN